VRALLGDYFLVILAVALVVGAVGGVLAWQGYATEDTRLESREVASWESAGQFDHRATVVNDTAPFPEGTVLENRSTYFRELTPVLDGSFVYSYEASEAGDLAVNTTLVVVTRSVEEADGGTTEYWRTERVLTSDRAASVSPGETVSVPFSWNVTAALQDAASVEDSVGTTPGETELFVEARLDVSGTRNGQRVDQTRSYRLPVESQQGTYDVQDPGRVTEGDTRREQVAVPVAAGPLERLGGPALFVLGLITVAGLLIARSFGDVGVSEREREYLEYRATRQEYDDWITTARDTETVSGDERVAIDSLQGLVDLAIDTDSRVIEDLEANRLVVTHEDVSYVYDPPPAPGADEDDTDPDTGDEDVPEAFAYSGDAGDGPSAATELGGVTVGDDDETATQTGVPGDPEDVTDDVAGLFDDLDSVDTPGSETTVDADADTESDTDSGADAGTDTDSTRPDATDSTDAGADADAADESDSGENSADGGNDAADENDDGPDGDRNVSDGNDPGPDSN